MGYMGLLLQYTQSHILSTKGGLAFGSGDFQTLVVSCGGYFSFTQGLTCFGSRDR